MAILFPVGRSRDRILRLFAEAGIDAARIDFIDRQPRREYLAEFNRIDLCLDTLPYNGHTTSLDGLWMGVPTLTMVGKTIVGRAGLSQLSNLNLPEFITHTREEFIAAAVQLAADPQPLATLRQSLRAGWNRPSSWTVRASPKKSNPPTASRGKSTSNPSARPEICDSSPGGGSDPWNPQTTVGPYNPSTSVAAFQFTWSVLTW